LLCNCGGWQTIRATSSKKEDVMKNSKAGARARLCLALQALRNALVVSMALFTAAGCGNRLDRRVYVATTSDACAALGSANTPTTPPPVDVYRVSVVGRKHTIDNTQLAGGWMPAAAVDVLLNPERPDDAKPGVINPAPATAAADRVRPQPVLSIDSAGAVQHVSQGSRLVLLFGPDAQATLDEWMAAAANGRFIDPKVQADVERSRMRSDRCWLDAIRASLAGGSSSPAAPATATAAAAASAASEGLK
jgi:hypothetical protein